MFSFATSLRINLSTLTKLPQNVVFHKRITDFFVVVVVAVVVVTFLRHFSFNCACVLCICRNMFGPVIKCVEPLFNGSQSVMQCDKSIEIAELFEKQRPYIFIILCAYRM